MNITKQLSDSLLVACRYMLISKPKYISYDADGRMWHYNVKPKLCQHGWAGLGIRITHPPYADDWRDSLLEWVEPQEEPLADVLAQHGDLIGDTTEMVILYDIADTSKKVDDACKIAYRKHIESGNGTCWSRADCYRAAWQDALAWKGGDK